MNKIVPFKSNYETVKKFETIAFWMLVFSAIIIAILWIVPKFDFSEQTKNLLYPLKGIIKALSYVSMIGYLALSMIAKYLFYSAEKMKRDDLIDNSFGTSYSEINSKGYYNNEDIPLGIKKLAINTYESSYHTEHTLKKMLYKSSIKLLLLAVPFLLSVFTKGGDNIVRLLFEISIPTIMSLQLITILIYFIGVIALNERFKIELTNIGNKELVLKDYSRLLIPVMEYYNVKSWATINLDGKVFLKYNEIISKQWIDRKDKLKLV